MPFGRPIKKSSIGVVFPNCFNYTTCRQMCILRLYSTLSTLSALSPSERNRLSAHGSRFRADFSGRATRHTQLVRLVVLRLSLWVMLIYRSPPSLISNPTQVGGEHSSSLSPLATIRWGQKVRTPRPTQTCHRIYPSICGDERPDVARCVLDDVRHRGCG